MRTENNLQVEFYDEAMEHGAESRKKGRPVFKDVTLVKITNLLDRNVVIVRAATQDDRQRYRNEYQAYQNESKADSAEGTPLKEWPAVTRSQVRDAAFYKILTVEQVADMSSNQIGELGSEWEVLKKKAALYLKGSEENASAMALADENAELRKQLEAMQKLAKEQGDAKEAEKRGPGRPPKQEQKHDTAKADNKE